jgi:hypothetical protein
MAPIDILAVLRQDRIERYRDNLSGYADFVLRFSGDLGEALALIADTDHHIDLLIVDNDLDATHDFVKTLRQKYPRLLILLVDEDADFGLPGHADEISTDPFVNNDLARKIEKLVNDRRTESHRSDSLPAVRNISRQLSAADTFAAKADAATEVVRNLGYDYVAYYSIDATEPLSLSLAAQQGPNAVNAIAPEIAGPEDLMGWVAQNQQSHIAGPNDRPTHPLVARGRLGAVVCVPVTFNGIQYGVLAACNDRPDSIQQDGIMMLELVAAQLGAALAQQA